jgi:Trypsin-like peptidase domain
MTPTKHLLFTILLVMPLFAQQSVPPAIQHPRKGVATIAKETNGAVVSIVMADKGRTIGQGSGFLVSRTGRIVTNYHVIKNGDSAKVKLPDGSFFDVDGVIAFDKDRDVAVIHAHGNNFRTLALGDSARIQVGEEVVAIGSPLSLESTVSNGIVSGIRTEAIPASGSLLDQVTAPERKRELVQITAPISHGSSGGPLFNMEGEVVGITTAAIVAGENLNFAVPINDVKQLLAVPASHALLAFPNEAENETDEHASAAQDPIILDEDGATGFAEIFAVEPACAGLTLMRHMSGEGGYWILGVATFHELYKDVLPPTQDPEGRTFVYWHGLRHYTSTEHECSFGSRVEHCFDVDKHFEIYALIKGTRDADTIPDYCGACTTSTPASVEAGAKAVCTLVKGGGGGQVK